MRLAARLTVPPLAACLVLAGCTGSSSPAGGAASRSPRPTASSPPPTSAPPSATPTASTLDLLPGMPAPEDPADVWAADRPGNLSPAVTGFRDLVYVPNSKSNTVTEIDPHTF